MNSNLPIKEDNSFLGKIKNFFRKLFYRKNMENTEEKPVVSEENDAKNRFQEYIKGEVKNDYINEMKREEFLDIIESNPKLLYDLPVDKLEKLEDYYKISIKKYEEKLTRIINKNKKSS